MKDGFGDEIVVSTGHPTLSDGVYVSFESGPKYIDMALTPKKARKLAKKLKRAAKAVEAR
jgi:hypothetical protein